MSVHDRKKDSRLVWLDLEMTGLNPAVDVILEIATIITDNQLNIIEEGPTFIIHQPDSALALMDKWVTNQHGKTGLTEAVRNSSITLEQAYEETLAFVKKLCPYKTGVLAGNSVWMDRSFLIKYMPALVDHLHYRLIDISAIKEVIQRWYPHNSHKTFKKADNHRALEDVRESIRELEHYRKYFFISSNS